MPRRTPAPRSIDTWLSELDGQLLPVPADHHLRVRRALADSRRSLRDIAELMQNCPALALSVMREANRQSNELSEPAESLENALNRLGLKRVEALLERQPAVPQEDISQALRQIQLISQHATQQANGLFAGRLARLWQEIHWGSLLFLAPLWSLLAARPELFAVWEQRILVNNEPALKVEREVLGVPLLKLCLAVAEHWHLPEWIVQGYRLLANDRRLLIKALHIAHINDQPLQQQQRLDADPTLRRWLTQPANSILLANCLALSAHQSWGGAHSMRWQRLAGLYLQTPLADLQQHIHQHAAQSARQQMDTELWHPASALLWPWDASHLETTLPPPVKAVDVDEWRQLCARLLSRPSAFDNVAQLGTSACQAIQACGMQRVLLLLADRTHSRLLVQQHAGLDPAPTGLKLDPQNSQVLRRLLQAPAQLKLNPGNIAQFSALLPGSLKTLFPSEHLLIRSLASNGRVVMIILADQTTSAISDTTAQAFGKTAQCIERALDSFAKRGH